MERPFPTSGINGLAGRMEKKINSAASCGTKFERLFVHSLHCMYFLLL